MDRDKIMHAIAMAQEFVERARKVLSGDQYTYGNGKDSGALRRQSMELTRVLTEMRKR
jgi:hypothetical protein